MEIARRRGDCAGRSALPLSRRLDELTTAIDTSLREFWSTLRLVCSRVGRGWLRGHANSYHPSAEPGNKSGRKNAESEIAVSRSAQAQSRHAPHFSGWMERASLSRHSRNSINQVASIAREPCIHQHSQAVTRIACGAGDRTFLRRNRRELPKTQVHDKENASVLTVSRTKLSHFWPPGAHPRLAPKKGRVALHSGHRAVRRILHPHRNDHLPSALRLHLFLGIPTATFRAPLNSAPREGDSGDPI